VNTGPVEASFKDLCSVFSWLGMLLARNLGFPVSGHSLLVDWDRFVIRNKSLVKNSPLVKKPRLVEVGTYRAWGLRTGSPSVFLKTKPTVSPLVTVNRTLSGLTYGFNSSSSTRSLLKARTLDKSLHTLAEVANTPWTVRAQ